MLDHDYAEEPPNPIMIGLRELSSVDVAESLLEMGYLLGGTIGIASNEICLSPVSDCRLHESVRFKRASSLQAYLTSNDNRLQMAVGL